MERVEFVGRASLAVCDVISCLEKMLLEDIKVRKDGLFLFSFELVCAHEHASVIRCLEEAVNV